MLSIGKAGDKFNTVYLRNWQPGQFHISLSGEAQDRLRPSVAVESMQSRAENNFVDPAPGRDAIDGGLGNGLLYGTEALTA